jgi:site-specific recombinase XerD
MQPYDLVAKFLYGCGLRLLECLKLRVQNFNFGEEVLAVMDGKGGKARIRSRVSSPLTSHLHAFPDSTRMDASHSML